MTSTTEEFLALEMSTDSLPLSPNISSPIDGSLMKTMEVDALKKKGKLKQNRFVLAGIVVVDAVLISLILYFSLRQGCSTPLSSRSEACRSTAPHLILLSLDGFRYEYLERHLTPTFDYVTSNGLRSVMYAQFPTKTFPNHYSIVTGLNLESHGIVSNSFFDSSLNDTFHVGGPTALDEKWWGGEPIWQTASNQGLKSASINWPGSEAAGKHPDLYFEWADTFNKSMEWRVDQALDWLNQPDGPSFISIYVALVDDMGHAFGPDSPQIDNAIREVDRGLRRFLDGIEASPKRAQTNLMITSDHGMAALSPLKTIDLTQIITDPSIVVENLPNALIYPHTDEELQRIYLQLKELSGSQPFKVYLKNEIPKRFQYRDNIRIPPLIAIPDEPYVFVIGTQNITTYMKGNHGFDNMDKDMEAVFLAIGPRFRRNLILEPFRNTELYRIMTEILRLEAAPNNGTLEGFNTIKAAMYL